MLVNFKRIDNHVNFMNEVNLITVCKTREIITVTDGANQRNRSQV